MTTLTTTTKNVPQGDFPPNWLSSVNMPQAICRDVHEAARHGEGSKASRAYDTLLGYLKTNEERTLRLLNLWVTGCTRSSGQASGAGLTKFEGIRPKLMQVVSTLAQDDTLRDETRGSLRVLSQRLLGPTGEPVRRVWSDSYLDQSAVKEVVGSVIRVLNRNDVVKDLVAQLQRLLNAVEGTVTRQICDPRASIENQGLLIPSALILGNYDLIRGKCATIWRSTIEDPSVVRAVDRMSARMIWSPKASFTEQVNALLWLKDVALLRFSAMALKNFQNSFDQAVAQVDRTDRSMDLDSDTSRARALLGTIDPSKN